LTQHAFAEGFQKLPGHATLLAQQADLLAAAGRHREAETYYRAVLAQAPTAATIHHRLGNLLAAAGRRQDAVACYREAIRLAPRLAQAHKKLGALLCDAGAYESAVAHLKAAIEINPRNASAHAKLARSLQGLSRLDLEPVAEHLRIAVSLDPGRADFHASLGGILQLMGRGEEARACYGAALALKPEHFGFRLRATMAELPVIYQTEAEIAERRRAYSESLAALEQLVATATLDPKVVVSAVGAAQPFLLGYQGLPDRDLQSRYGAVICAAMATVAPEAARPLEMPKLASSEPIRVGIVSGQIRLHAVWKGARGLFECLDPRRFRLFAYYTQGIRDGETAAVEARCARFVQGPRTSADWRTEIGRDAPHVLVYPEIGMDPMTPKLAALRLAPVQCTWWGHSDTSGLPTIDYFLSSDLMEPPGAKAEYTECLVRLPNLGTVYRPPELEPLMLGRSELGMRWDAVVYWCCQALFKYLPQYDEIFVRIAERVPNAQLVFNAAPNDKYATAQFMERITRVFAARGLDARRHTLMLPRLGARRFLAACGLCDVFLDSVGWSGFNTTMESLTHHLPIVTWPTGLMRGRQSAAILQVLGVTETVAQSLDSYIGIAVQLGLNRPWRDEVRAKLAAALPRLSDDTPVRAFEAWLEKVVRGGPA